VAVTRHKWAPSRFFFEMYCPDRSSRAKSRIAAGPQSANRVNFCDCRHEIIGKTAVLLSPVKGGRKNSRYGPSPPPPLLPPPSFPFFPGRLGSSAASRRFWAELGAPAAPGTLIFGEPQEGQKQIRRLVNSGKHESSPDKTVRAPRATRRANTRKPLVPHLQPGMGR
jgi:hypothetical protein